MSKHMPKWLRRRSRDRVAWKPRFASCPNCGSDVELDDGEGTCGVCGYPVQGVEADE